MGAYNISGILALTAVLALVAFGQLLVLLTAGIDVSAGPVVGLVVNVASFYLIAGATLAQQATGFLLMFGVAIAVGVVNWALIEFVKLNPLIATLATFMAIQGVSLVLRPSPGGTISSSIIATVTYKVGPIPVAFVIVLALAIVLGVALKRSRLGMAVRAVGSDAEAARVDRHQSPPRSTLRIRRM